MRKRGRAFPPTVRVTGPAIAVTAPSCVCGAKVDLGGCELPGSPAEAMFLLQHAVLVLSLAWPDLVGVTADTTLLILQVLLLLLPPSMRDQLHSSGITRDGMCERLHEGSTGGSRSFHNTVTIESLAASVSVWMIQFVL